MTVRAALDAIKTKQESLSISDPRSLSISRAYKYVPSADKAYTDLPCFVNTWRLAGRESGTGLRVLRYEVRMQLVLAKTVPETDERVDEATAFWEAMLAAFDSDMSLGDVVTESVLRTGENAVVELNLPNGPFIGLDTFLDVEVKEAFAFG